ncbi:ABC transporter permease [Geminicoccaceae bacterium 1502E]|nr:ABC transporter permease [Geminicoccaceae bacterium 1502E]
MPLLGFLARRTVYGLVLLAAVLILNFLLVHMAPGDPAEMIVGEMGGATQEILDAIRASYGLDRPLHEQLLLYLGKAVQGDLGHSYYFNTSVTQLILERVGATVLLVLTSLVVAILAGVVLGVAAARRPNGLVSHLTTILALAGYSLPIFWTGLILIILFASVLPIFPVANMTSTMIEGGFFARLADILHHLVLPAATLAIVYVAQYSRLARASMLEVLGADYIRTARAKGLNERLVVYKHALRNAVLPIVTIAGLQFGQLLSGAVLTETVFNWPGLGRLAFDSILRRDYPTILGILFFSTLLVIVANILTDLCYRIVDPRIRLEGGRG